MTDGPEIGKLVEEYERYHDGLKRKGYSSFERGLVYAGHALGMLAPVAAARFLFPEANSRLEEVGYWAASSGGLAMMSAVMKGFPLIYTGGIGAAIGAGPAFILKKIRERRREGRRGIENEVG